MKKLNFSWSTSQSEANPQVEYRLYENGEMIIDNIAELQFTLLMTDKEPDTYAYHVTATDERNGLESAPSNVVEVAFFPPVAPSGLSATFSA